MNTIAANRIHPENGSWNLVQTSIVWATTMINTLDTWRQRQKSRAQFAELDARILRDSGISEAQRFIEGNKPFWEA